MVSTLLQCYIDALFSRPSHTTINNITNINYGSSNQKSRKDKRKEEDGRKLLASGITAVVVVIIFHVSMCYLYNRRRKMAGKSSKTDYLDNKLQTFRNIEFVNCTVSLIALVA
ncbi:MAG: hypothetical protein PV345_05990 [Wolbachia sp.]|nr:hypothetical protein [Wolbachia sp.]